MKCTCLIGLVAFAMLSAPPAPAHGADDDGKLRIICFGAHPDDCEYQVGGMAAKWAAAGHKVKLVSTTNGDIGHFRMSGGPLAKRRTAEAKEAARILGVESEVLDIHDGELMPTLENRRTFVRLIRRWKADVVMTHRPNDYHPDHRYTGVLVMDSSYMVTVPFFCPDVPALKRNPVYMYYRDRFQTPNPFEADIAVGIDDVWDKKAQAMCALVSQFFEGGVHGSEARVSQIPKTEEERVKYAKSRRGPGHQRTADDHRELLVKFYGPERGQAVKYAEVLEICEYGRRPNEA
ncbi:PIG-L deacetylase family protein, partial [Planctomycetota bacterium]